jgi:hypothetical protein
LDLLDVAGCHWKMRELARWPWRAEMGIWSDSSLAYSFFSWFSLRLEHRLSAPTVSLEVCGTGGN